MNSFIQSCLHSFLRALIRYIIGLFLALIGIVVMVWIMSRPPSKLELANNAARENQRQAQINRINTARDYFVIQMSKVEGVESTTISEQGDVVIVRFVPLAHIGTDHVRVLCEGIAYKWAAAAGLSFVRCESWYGGKMYASGNYNGPIPTDFESRKLRKSLAGIPEVQQPKANTDQTEIRIRRLLDLRQQIEGKSYATIVAMHGEPLSKDRTTGWALWKNFKVQFQTGKALTVEITDSVGN